MNRLLIILILIFGFKLYGQKATLNELIQRDYQIKRALAIKTHSQIRYRTDYEDSLSLVFQLDTLKANRETAVRLDSAMTMYDMIQVFVIDNSNYDVLLNKYYKRLMNRLSPNDQLILKESQINWIKFRDSEIKTIRMISANKYAGGGTMEGLDNMTAICSLTMHRVDELYQHLFRLY